MVNIKNLNKKVYSSQKGTVLPGVIILVFILMLAVMLAVVALGYAKNKLEKACNFKWGLSKVLGQTTTDILCAAIGATPGGGTGTGGLSGCAGSSVDLNALKQQLQSDEGLRLYPYKDSNKKCTIGYGHNLEGGSNANFTSATNLSPADFISKCCPNSKSQCSGAPTITQDQADALFESDLGSIQTSAADIVGQDTYNSLPGSAKQILVEMRFQLGEVGLKKFVKMIAALQESPPNFAEAANQIRDSSLYDQTTSRAENQAARMENIRCEKAVIPSVGSNKTCSLEENCQPAGTYGNNWKICQAAIDKLLLVQIDTNLVNVNEPPRYITMNMADAIENASQDPSCKKCFTVNSAYRNCAHQNNLFNSGQSTAKGGESNHNGGQGVDITATGKWYCNSEKCSVDLVNLLDHYGLKLFRGCSTIEGNYYVTTKKGGYQDCLHFSPNGG